MSRLLDKILHGGSRHEPYYSGGGYGMGRALVLELLVPMCCAQCEEKIYEEMMELRGVQGVLVDRQAQRVIVHGFVDPLKVLRKAKKVKRDTQLWTTGAPYGRDVFSSPMYGRSAYRSPSIYRSSSLESRPSVYRTSAYEPSVYRSSCNRYTPSYGQGSYMPSYGQGSYMPSYGQGSYMPSYGQGSYMPSYGQGAYMSSYGQAAYMPSYGRGAYEAPYGMQQPWPVYDDMYRSDLVTNPYYVKHIDSEYLY